MQKPFLSHLQLNNHKMVEDGRSLAGYTLDDVLANNRLGPPPAAARTTDRTLLDVIRDEEPGATKGLFGKDKRTWKSFRDKLRLKRAGSAWVSTVPIPTSDMPMPVHNKRSLIGKRNQVRFSTPLSRHSNQPEESSKAIRRQMSRTSSTMNSSSDSSAFQYDESADYSQGPDASLNRTLKPQMSRNNSVRIDNYSDPTEPDRDYRVRNVGSAFSERRMMSAREAVAAQEAADAAYAAAAAAEAAAEEKEHAENDQENENEKENENEESTTGSENEEESEPASEPMRMSLMDLLHETDREMGFEGSSYGMEFAEDFFDVEEDDYFEEDEDDGKEGEFSCSVCSVKHKNSALAPCGHTFCRLCSKELMVSRGNCPTCNDFILEIVESF